MQEIGIDDLDAPEVSERMVPLVKRAPMMVWAGQRVGAVSARVNGKRTVTALGRC
jgi:hypothetical protein